VVTSLLSLEAARVDDPVVREMLQTTQNRVRSMALIHQTLYQSKDFARVDFQAFLRSFVPTLIQSYSLFPERIALELNVAEIRLAIDAAIPCGLIVNELVSNAVKHAFRDGRVGQIEIGFKQDGGRDATLSVTDDGVGIAEDFALESSGTLGMQLVSMLAGQLGGALSVQRISPTRIAVSFPLEQ
jgi:two-component sensor histidine kinase